ncbi:M20/M25/M40 family metallo-hydrolase [Sabulicella rubraurantiaca]|uniref:M20/M25/M40 family metallo-hydrolase n=1 Tax=Sabulicella rubraurantiaca TaxID=2811429 RepID=UPI001A965996|nr:M20/M25/M40 family metallo-hydrolase [Sabulicella rubraurantiaca]
MRYESLSFLKRIIAAASPSGSEEQVAQLYRDYVGPFADEVRTDLHGNVTAALNPTASAKIMLAGHMDEIGFIIHHIADDGLLYFNAIGGHDSAVPVGQLVWVYGRERITGVIGRKAPHLLGPEEAGSKPKLGELWIDIGAASRDEAEEVVEVGDLATYQYEFRPLLGDRAAARGFDNKAGLFIVAEALRHLKEEGGLHEDVGVFAVGTVQEEIGSRGAWTAAAALGARTGIAVDMEHAIDLPGLSQTQFGKLDMGKGPSISRGANTNPVVFRLLRKAAIEAGLPFQVRVAPGTTPTDAKAMQISGHGMATGLVGIPLRYMHTPSEVLSLSDVGNCSRLVAAYCRQIQPDTDFTPR